jgi:Ca2+-binding RTX toxin-like protein
MRLPRQRTARSRVTTTAVNAAGGSNSTITVGNGNDTIHGRQGDTMTVGNGNDAIYVGRNDRVKVGNDHNSLVFEQMPQFGLGMGWVLSTRSPSITFNPSNDIISLSSQWINSISYQDNSQGNAVITVVNAGTITLVGVHASALLPSGFHFA